ncbi:MAG: GDSL-type esterase/lipase family protein [Polaromonas sp.]
MTRALTPSAVALSPILPLMLVLLVLGACARAHAAPEAATERSSYWRERTSLFRTFSHPADVAMLGDSLTDGAEWREIFPGLDIVNRGIDSDTTDGVLARLEDLVSGKPRQVFVMIGLNDFADSARSVDAVFTNYRAIVSRLEQAGVKVFVQSTLPCNETKGAWKSCATLNSNIRQLNARLATLASARVTFIDLTPALTDAKGLKDAFTFDGVHLNGEGYRRWKEAIAPFMPAGHKAARPVP